MTPHRRLLATALALVLAGGLAGCGGSGTADGAAGSSADGASTSTAIGSEAAPVTEATVVSPSTSFDVTTIYVKAGQPVTLTYDNRHAGVPHNLHVSGTGVDEMTSITSGPDVQTITVTFPTAGKYGYVCDVHASMVGVVIAV